MSRDHTKAEIINMLEKAKSEITLFYKQDFINYRGKTADTNEFYTEIIAEWILRNAALFEKIPRITRQSSYKVSGHNGETDNASSNRVEERIALEMFRQNDLGILGKVIDYQTPLKNSRSDKAGKIDLLAYDGETLRILELKKPDSEETMLRCVVEGYTYLKTVDNEKLLFDFELPPETKVRACPFVFRNGCQHSEMFENRPMLKKLMKLWDCKPYYITCRNGKYEITED